MTDNCSELLIASCKKKSVHEQQGNTSAQIHGFVVMLCVVLVEYVQVSIPLDCIILDYMSGKLRTVKLSAQESGWI